MAQQQYRKAYDAYQQAVYDFLLTFHLFCLDIEMVETQLFGVLLEFYIIKLINIVTLSMRIVELFD